MKYKDMFMAGKELLEKAGIAEADLDARLLLEAVCGTNRNDLLVHGDREVTEEQKAQYLQWIARRSSHVPLQQITGTQDFMGLTFEVNEKVLIPRQDTEILTEEVLKNLNDGSSILDMCTGSGCILLSLLHYSNDCTGTGVDISAEALAVAGENAERLLEEKKYSQVSWIESNLFEKLTGKFDVIVSNPPYIASDVIPTLMPEVCEHEPILALDGREDGLFFYREIVKESVDYLIHGGMLFFEIGYDQGAAVSSLMAEYEFREIHVIQDYAGLDRVVYGTHLG